MWKCLVSWKKPRLNSIILVNLCLNPSICMLMQPVDRISRFTSFCNQLWNYFLQNALGFIFFPPLINTPSCLTCHWQWDLWLYSLLITRLVLWNLNLIVSLSDWKPSMATTALRIKLKHFTWFTSPIHCSSPHLYPAPLSLKHSCQKTSLSSWKNPNTSSFKAFRPPQQSFPDLLVLQSFT